jgi:hypothetical protein
VEKSQSSSSIDEEKTVSIFPNWLNFSILCVFSSYKSKSLSTIISVIPIRPAATDDSEIGATIAIGHEPATKTARLRDIKSRLAEI